MHEKLIRLASVLAKYNLKEEANFIVGLTKKADSRGKLMSLLHFPPIVADYLHNKYGKYSFLIGRWIHEFYSKDKNKIVPATIRNVDASMLSDWPKKVRTLGEALEILDEMQKVLLIPEDERKEFWANSDIARYYDLSWWANDKDLDLFGNLLEDRKLYENIKNYKKAINQFFWYFEYQDLIKAINSGKVNIRKYKSLSFYDAQQKYIEEGISHAFPTILQIDNWRWIDVGPKCNWLGDKMKNCGSSGVMFGDDNRTILALLDGSNDPHAMLTWSPDSNIITGIEGKASKELKYEYWPYVRMLIQKLGDVKFHTSVNDIEAEYFSGKIDIKRIIKTDKAFNEFFFHVEEPDGTEWIYTKYITSKSKYKLKYRPEFDDLTPEELYNIWLKHKKEVDEKDYSW